ncbi:ATP-binding protein [Hydrogenophaga aquatica]
MDQLVLTPLTAYVPLGGLYALVAITLWTVLAHQADRVSAAYWCGGAMMSGLGWGVLGWVGWTGLSAGITFGAALSVLGYVLRVAAIRRDMSLHMPWLWVGLCAGVWLVAVYGVSGLEGGRLLMDAALFHFGQMAGAAWLAWQAVVLHRKERLANAALLAIAYGFYVFTLILRLALWGLHDHTQLADEAWNDIDWLLNMVALVLASLYGSYGYLGLSLERSHRVLMQTSRELEAKTAMDAQSVQLAQRLSEKARLLTMLTKEVRSPVSQALNRVRGALLESSAAVHGPSPSLGHVPRAYLKSAQELLRDVIQSVDDTSTAIALSQQKFRPRKTEMELGTLIELVTADLDLPDAVQRLRINNLAESRIVELDVNLMRHALKNVLARALVLCNSDEVVTWDIWDDDETLSLHMCIAGATQEGKNTLPSQYGQMSEEDVYSGGKRLGLYVARKIVENHGGVLQFNRGHATDSRTWVANLALPQGIAY